MRVLVTGGAGYIGSHMLKALSARGAEVVVFDNLSSGRREAVGSRELVIGDINSSADLRALFSPVSLRRCHAFRLPDSSG